jgi:hypothetical protein
MEGDPFVEVDMKKRGWHSVISGIACWLCYAAVIAVLVIFGVRLLAGVNEVRQGETTPAEMLEDVGDWLTGRE